MIDTKNHLLFAVNTDTSASNGQDCNQGSITSFRIARDGRLAFAGKVLSGGLFPDSLTVRGNHLVVLNAGGKARCGKEPNITGFRVNADGRLTAIAGTTRNIGSGTSPGSFLNCDPGNGPFVMPIFNCGLNPPAFPRSPGQVGFSPKGDALVVTVKGTNSIYVFPFDPNDELKGPGVPTVWKAPGPTQPTYFGFAFASDDNLIVAEPFGASATIPAPGASSVSSFRLKSGLTAISSNVANGQTAACWVAIDPLTKRYAYVSNNGSGAISLYAIDGLGNLTLIAAAAGMANGANELAMAGNAGNSFLYVLNSGGGTVGAFRVNPDGSLNPLANYAGMPVDAGAQGLAAY